MPNLDGTGPWGWGPRTGRMMGYCPRYSRYAVRPRALVSKEEELQFLKDEKGAIEKEIADLEGGK